MAFWILRISFLIEWLLRANCKNAPLGRKAQVVNPAAVAVIERGWYCYVIWSRFSRVPGESILKGKFGYLGSTLELRMMWPLIIIKRPFATLPSRNTTVPCSNCLNSKQCTTLANFIGLRSVKNGTFRKQFESASIQASLSLSTNSRK